MEEYQIGDQIKVKLTGDKALIVGKVINSETVYIVRLCNYSEVTLRGLEISGVLKEEV